MNFTVLWDPEAEQELAAIWVAAADRAAVTAATDEIDRLLRTNPEQRGESRDDGRRILLVAPLGVLFRVLPDDRVVRVLQVWSF
jgi:plasmid stabilization system protein ParE